MSFDDGSGQKETRSVTEITWICKTNRNLGISYDQGQYT